MLEGSVTAEKSAPKISFFTDSWQIIPEVRHIINGLVEVSQIIKEHTFSQSYKTYIDGTTVWESLQDGIPDKRYGTRPTKRKWIYSSRDTGSKPNFTLSAITVANYPNTLTPFPVQPEIRIKLPLSEQEKVMSRFVLFGDLAICIGLRMPDGSIEKEDGKNPKTNQQMLERACLVVDTFIIYLNSYKFI